MVYVNVFDKLGHLDFSQIDDAVVASLDASQQAALSALVEAHQYKQGTAQRLTEAMAASRAALADADEKQKLYIASAPPVDPIEAIRAVQRAQMVANGLIGEDSDFLKPPKKSHPKAAVAGPRLAHEKAQVILAEKRSLVEVARRADVAAEKMLGEAVINLNAVNKGPDQLEVAREFIDRGDQARLARVKDGLPAIEPPAPKKHASALDAQATARGRAGTRNSLQSNVARRVV
ncbi:hypothetical protein QNJ95_42675 [Bradyrhizobium elkanii]|uniref:hypothetical protein n=1 Tax=Bradyrhizobium TaxID=374 RepID=UPI002711FC52|nr:hypothetical protein [Bradyrhizobium elkanii]WLA39476.1 hypothetical protein QNJ95_42675 [Bradyrhizobium elkanii]